MSKRNDVADAVVDLLRAGVGKYLSACNDESEISRGPADLRFLEDLDITELRVLVDLGEDDVAPATLSREGHEMIVYVLVVMRATDVREAMRDAAEFGREVEACIYADRTLGGQVDESHVRKFTPGYVAGDTDTLAFVQIELACQFQTTG
jgi:hypothetical protein